MVIFRTLSAVLLIGTLVGCCNSYEWTDCSPRKGRLVDVNSERGDIWGRNYYEYRSHELHPDHLRRYDFHPRMYHRFVQEDQRG